jgi:L-malate glycosyltransferase
MLYSVLESQETKGGTKVLFYYRFLGLGGVETMLINRIEALRLVGISGEFWCSDFHCTGARYLADTGFAKMVAKEEVATLACREDFEAVVVIESPGVLRRILKTAVSASIFFETHVSLPWRLSEFYSAASNTSISAVIVPSEYNKALVVKHAFVPPERVKVISNVVVDRVFRTSMHSTSDHPSILWVGRLEDEKNPQDAILIASALEKRRPDLRFILIGDDPEYHERINYLSEISGGLPSNMVLVRNVPYEAMADYYREAAWTGGALLITSKYESAPMIILEAMLFGCPVVASAVGGVPMMVRHGETGLLFASGDTRGAENLIDLITTDSALRATMTRRAEAHVRRCNAPKAVADALLSIFSSSRTH